jgi:hypothetical protein
MATQTLRGPDFRRMRQTGRAARRSGVEASARMGYAARAVVYGVVGLQVRKGPVTS